LIDVDDSPPVALQHVSGNVYDKSQRQTGYIHAVDFPFFEMVRQRGIASPVVRVDADPAGAEHLAIADFQKASFEFVRHGDFPPFLLSTHWEEP
jgi:hypothetical protein